MRLANLAGRAVLVLDGGGLDLERAGGGRLPSEPQAVLDRWPDVVEWWREARESLPAPDVRIRPEELLAPSPAPRQVFAVALNYAPHAAEAGYVPPDEPLVFTKFPSCVTGPVTTVTLPPGRVDWEVELVAVIGRETYAVPVERGWDAVAGITVGQDISERLTQVRGTPPQFSLGKSFPGFGPTGPYLCTPDEVPDPDDLGIECSVNGERMQSARTKDMIFPVPDLVSRLSRICRLFPGDLIFTGTPAGVGNRMTPPRYLADGDVLVSTVEGIGELRTAFRAAP